MVADGVDGVSNLRSIRTGNLRPAPAELTPALADRFVALAGQLAVHSNRSPRDASVAGSGRTNGESHAPTFAAEEAGRDSTEGRKW